jgi:hypothetical protein
MRTCFVDSFSLSSGPFVDYLYSVRQIVAFYRFDLAKWRDISNAYLHKYRLVEHDMASINE